MAREDLGEPEHLRVPRQLLLDPRVHLGRHVEGREVLSKLTATPGASQQARARALQAVSIVERPRACLVHPSPRCAETARESYHEGWRSAAKA